MRQSAGQPWAASERVLIGESGARAGSLHHAGTGNDGRSESVSESALPKSRTVVLMKSDPLDIARAVRLSKATVRKMKQNLAWASVYNLLAIPVAAGVFYSSLGWSLRPEISALLMSVSSIVVALNAVSLRRAKI